MSLQNDNDPLEIFIEGWGRMGSQWGISKVMGEIYALLYLSSRPLSLEEMSSRLETSRSNISLNVRALQDMGVVRKTLIRGDRRDYYTIEEDIRKVAVRIAEGKMKRELDPALEIIDKALAAASDCKVGAASSQGDLDFYIERLGSLKSLVETVKAIFETFIGSGSMISQRGQENGIPTLKRIR
jgi:DNA-binding transcriptional regulator GbsR (MarR family)